MASKMFKVKKSFLRFDEGDIVTAEDVVTAGADLQFLVGNGALKPMFAGPIPMMADTVGEDTHVTKEFHYQAIAAKEEELKAAHAEQLKVLSDRIEELEEQAAEYQSDRDALIRKIEQPPVQKDATVTASTTPPAPPATTVTKIPPPSTPTPAAEVTGKPPYPPGTPPAAVRE